MTKFYWVAVVLHCTLIFLLSSLSKPPNPISWFPHSDKLGHALVFGFLSLLLWRGMWLKGRERAVKADLAFRLKISILAIVLTALYGLSDETHQLFVPDRHFELADLAADGAGAIIIQGILWWIAKWTSEASTTASRLS